MATLTSSAEEANMFKNHRNVLEHILCIDVHVICPDWNDGCEICKFEAQS